MAPSVVVMMTVAVVATMVTMVMMTVTSSRPYRTCRCQPEHDKSDARKFYFRHESLHSLVKDHFIKTVSRNNLLLLVDITRQ